MIAAVVLAAGGSTRMGRPKALIEHDGRTLLDRTVRAAIGGGCEPVVVVVGAAADEIRPHLEHHAVEIVDNPHWTEGMSESIRQGISAVANNPAVRAVLLLTIDQPAIDDGIVHALCAAFNGTPEHRVASRYADTVGVPALFGRGLFAELQQLTGDRGAKQLLLEETTAMSVVDWPPGERDIDCPADLTE